MDDIQKMKYLDVFEEDKNENLKLKINLRIKDEDFNIGDIFRKNEKIAGIDFHLLRYLDLAVKPITPSTENRYEVTGFFPLNK